MLDAGVPPHTVAERLGHRSVQMTLDRYGHAVPARDREAADALERLYR
jgi:integrase